MVKSGRCFEMVVNVDRCSLEVFRMVNSCNFPGQYVDHETSLHYNHRRRMSCFGRNAGAEFTMREIRLDLLLWAPGKGSRSASSSKRALRE